MSDRASVRARIGHRFATLLEWSLAEKCILVACIVLSFVVWYGIAEWYVLTRPEVAPYFDPTYTRHSFHIHVGELVVWALIITAAWWARSRAPESRLMVNVTLQAFSVTILIYGYLLGFVTSQFAGLTIVGGVAIGFVLFEPRPVMGAAATYMLVFTTLTLAEQLDLIPYAPMLSAAPHEAGRLSRWWLGTVGGPTILIELLFLGWIYILTDRWRDREDRVARTSEQLGRANDIISRYVASQLAQQIRAGNYEAVDRHDRRRLTLFFSDIEDFATTADHVEPEDLSEVLNEYLSEMARIAERYGGTIDKFVGDAVMIFFGAPQSTSDRDQALRAVRMAIEMQATIAELRERWTRAGFEFTFHVRMGINTGQASIGNFGSEKRADYTAIGRQVNLAARLQGQCARDRILLSHATYALVRDDVRSTPKGEITVKGFRDPVKVYEVEDMTVTWEDASPDAGAASLRAS